MSKKVLEKAAEAINDEARLTQLYNKALNLAEQQLMDGTASSQTINFFLKLGTEKEQKNLELELTKGQVELTKRKTQALESADQTKEKYEAAIRAFRQYSGEGYEDL